MLVNRSEYVCAFIFNYCIFPYVTVCSLYFIGIQAELDWAAFIHEPKTKERPYTLHGLQCRDQNQGVIFPLGVP